MTVCRCLGRENTYLKYSRPRSDILYPLSSDPPCHMEYWGRAGRGGAGEGGGRMETTAKIHQFEVTENNLF